MLFGSGQLRYRIGLACSGRDDISARSERVSAFQNLSVNRWLWGAVTVSALLQVAVVNAPPLNVAFGTKPLTLDQWIVCLAMGSSVLWAAEARKWFLRRQVSS